VLHLRDSKHVEILASNNGDVDQCIYIRNFKKYQHIHVHEAASTLSCIYIPGNVGKCTPTSASASACLSPPSEKKEYSPPPRGEAIPYGEIIGTLNRCAGTAFTDHASGTRRLIAARWKEGRRLPDFVRVIEAKSAEWKDDPKWRKFLRPETLFNATKMESYLGAVATVDQEIPYESEPWK
jgi:uncharacterized phage protein (TIGR02220 family)